MASRKRPAPTGRRIEFRSKLPGLSLMGLGWSAQFDDGVFVTDDARTAQGIAKRAEQHPEYGITARAVEAEAG